MKGAITIELSGKSIGFGTHITETDAQASRRAGTPRFSVRPALSEFTQQIEINCAHVPEKPF